MKLIVEQVYPTVTNPMVLVRVDESSPTEPIEVGSQLRCGGYRFTVERVAGEGRQFGVELKSDFGIRPGMVLRPAALPLDADERASVHARIVHVLQCLSEIDLTSEYAQLHDSAGTPYLRGDEYGIPIDIVRVLHEAKTDLPTLAKQREYSTWVARLNKQLGDVVLMSDNATVGS
jgi:hypothetical protein